MENAMALAAVIGPIYFVIGLSCLLHAKAWQKLLEKFKNDHFTLFTLMLIYLVLGMIIVGMYNVWTWHLWLLVTLTGWALLVKGVFYMLAPGSWIKTLLGMKSQLWVMYAGGIVGVVIGGVMSYYVYFV